MCCAFFMCRETTSGSNKAVSPPLRKSLHPCAPATLHARFEMQAFPLRCWRALLSPRRMLRVWNRIIKIMLTLLLAYSLSPKVQSIFWGPRLLRFWPNKLILFVCLSYACLFLFPTGTQYPAGSPYFKKSASRWCAVFVIWDNLWARTQPNGCRSHLKCIF